jgi:hypothetical protein
LLAHDGGDGGVLGEDDAVAVLVAVLESGREELPKERSGRGAAGARRCVHGVVHVGHVRGPRLQRVARRRGRSPELREHHRLPQLVMRVTNVRLDPRRHERPLPRLRPARNPNSSQNTEIVSGRGGKRNSRCVR